MPLDWTLLASDLKFGSTTPLLFAFFDTFWTVSTTTDDVSWAPTSAKLSPTPQNIIPLVIL